jgi:hypothetical protein
MFISTAYAQAAAPAGGGGDIFMSLLPLVMVFAMPGASSGGGFFGKLLGKK